MPELLTSRMILAQVKREKQRRKRPPLQCVATITKCNHRESRYTRRAISAWLGGVGRLGNASMDNIKCLKQ